MTHAEPVAVVSSEDRKVVAELLREDLGLRELPVQLTYLDAPIEGAAKDAGALPSVCSFFMTGMTRPVQAPQSDHQECEIGAFVMGIEPKGPLGDRLMGTVGWMEKVGYLSPGEAMKIPKNAKAPNWVAYAPLGSIPEEPSVVLLTTGPRGLMLVVEATALGRPTLPPAPLLARPMCSLVPVLLQGTPVAVSVGCAGSRINTEMPDSEVLVGVRGDALMELADAVHHLKRANEQVWKEDVDRRAKSLAAHPSHAKSHGVS